MTSLPVGLFSKTAALFERSEAPTSNSSSPSLASASIPRTPRPTQCISSFDRSSRELSCNVFKGRYRIWTRKKTGASAKRRWSAPLVEARLLGPAIFESSKLRILVFPSKDEEEKGRQDEPRIYTLTHSDFTAQISLTIAREINNSQLGGWYRRLQRDEVLAEWRKAKGIWALHVHCHISGGGNCLHLLIAKLRLYIFHKELPVVLQAFMVGDRQYFQKHPELTSARVWVYFHSSSPEYNLVECWGSLEEAIQRRPMDEKKCQESPTAACAKPCHCCSLHKTVVQVPESF